MPSFRTRHRVRHSADDMFTLVADVEKYPQFVPLCERLLVRRREERDDGTAVLVADMTVAYSFFRETFTSRVTLDPPHLRIFVEYVNGPFRHMENRWEFRPLQENDRCEVDFYISWEMKSRTLSAMVGGVFERAFRRFARAFEARADAVYGAA
jgi:coenzyme Q-binding protein COQ10